MGTVSFGLAFLLDLILGDPQGWPHPVRLIGRAIDTGEKRLRRLVATPRGEIWAGGLLAATVVTATFLVTWLAVRLAARAGPWVSLGVESMLLASTLATRNLAQAAQEIYHLLETGDLARARAKLSWIVGRDTADLDPAEVIRATVETVAENTVDGVTAPLFYGLLGGAPLAMAYKAVNTLDSMIGYRNDRYLYFGRIAARLDDIANFLPARLTGLAMLLVTAVAGLNSRGAWATWRRDAKKHPSPNSGIPEALLAGALGVRLGGINYYGGVASCRALIGEPRHALATGHILAATRLLYATAGLFWGVGLLLLALN